MILTDADYARDIRQYRNRELMDRRGARVRSAHERVLMTTAEEAGWSYVYTGRNYLTFYRNGGGGKLFVTTDDDGFIVRWSRYVLGSDLPPETATISDILDTFEGNTHP